MDYRQLVKEMNYSNLKKCSICGCFTSNLAKHLNRQRCKKQGRNGVKAGKVAGTKDRGIQ